MAWLGTRDAASSVGEPGQEPPPAIRLTGLSKTYRTRGRDSVTAVRDVFLDVAPGEMLVLLGPSGCGKTTLLRCIAGLETPDTGQIQIAGQVAFDSTRRRDVPTEQRPLSMMYQSYALWPHMTALQNVGYPLKAQGVARAEIRTRALEMLDMVGVRGLADVPPNGMSGGQQQRVALARALVAGRGVVLFDEPLSNVDANVREQLRHELSRMQRDLQFAGIYVTHDQAEALALGHRVAVLHEGSIIQVGTPRDVYHRPRSRYVAEFVGATNKLPGTFVRDEDGWAVVSTAIGDVHGVRGDEDISPGDDVVVAFRPERLLAESDGAPHEPVNCWTAKVTGTVFGGAYVEYLIRIGETELRTWRMSADAPDEVGELTVHLRARGAHVLPAV
jgi:iron(III) transport system ATP-binding protein